MNGLEPIPANLSRQICKVVGLMIRGVLTIFDLAMIPESKAVIFRLTLTVSPFRKKGSLKTCRACRD